MVIAAAITGLKSRRPTKRPAGGCIGGRDRLSSLSVGISSPLLRSLLILTGENGREIIARTLPRSTSKQMLLSYQNLIVRHFYEGNICYRNFVHITRVIVRRSFTFVSSRSFLFPFCNFHGEILCNLFLHYCFTILLILYSKLLILFYITVFLYCFFHIT